MMYGRLPDPPDQRDYLYGAVVKSTRTAAMWVPIPNLAGKGRNPNDSTPSYRPDLYLEWTEPPVTFIPKIAIFNG